MPLSLPLYIGLRYVRAKRRNRFISFVSAFALVGMALGVMSLIVVLSVMNGFDREMKQRLLSVVPHGFVDQLPTLTDWRSLSLQLEENPQVLASAPYISGFGLISYARGVEGLELQGVLPEAESRVSVVDQHMLVGSLSDLRPGEFGIVMGALLARSLGLAPGDRVTMTLPDITVTPAGVYPRMRRFTLVGVFEVGAQVDQNLAMIHLDDARRLFRYADEDVQGLHLQLADIYRADQIMAQLARQLSDDYRLTDWSQTQGSLFQAVRMEKIVVSTLLSVIIAVAAFNIISSLVLMVADKRADIAVLRTLGLNARQVMAIFVVQGSAVGAAGTLAGVLLGCLLGLYIGDLVALLEAALGWQVFDPSVYYISYLPSVLLWQDVLRVAATALVLSLLATLYPAWRAAKIEPAEALRYE